eukprot:282319-Chlamydomonas_euryale.AAC.4
MPLKAAKPTLPRLSTHPPTPAPTSSDLHELLLVRDLHRERLVGVAARHRQQVGGAVCEVAVERRCPEASGAAHTHDGLPCGRSVQAVQHLGMQPARWQAGRGWGRGRQREAGTGRGKRGRAGGIKGAIRGMKGAIRA